MEIEMTDILSKINIYHEYKDRMIYFANYNKRLDVVKKASQTNNNSDVIGNEYDFKFTKVND